MLEAESNPLERAAVIASELAANAQLDLMNKKAHFRTLLAELEACLIEDVNKWGTGREFSLAKTHFQEGVMWALKGVDNL